MTKLGRDPAADIHIPQVTPPPNNYAQFHPFLHQRTVSNCHVVIEADEDGATIHDRHSANGTKMKGKRLKPNIRHHLEHKSSLLFGNVEAIWLEGAPGSKVGDSDGEMSDNLLEDEEENRCFGQIYTTFPSIETLLRPPVFIPETPVVTRTVADKAKLYQATDLSFVPESQSSPLPGSVLRHLDNR